MTPSTRQPAYFLISQQPSSVSYPTSTSLNTSSYGTPSSGSYSGFASSAAYFSSRHASSSTITPAHAANSTTGTGMGTGAGTSTEFRAPAHKHAHHLHTIPPREKSTRTLIVDHMLWVHARTRFAQARAELGMTDRTGGQGALNFRHRERPEEWDEEEEAWSDGEENSFVAKKRAAHGSVSGLFTPGVAPANSNVNQKGATDETERVAKQDMKLAWALRTRAESVEKVISSMLAQPPPVLPSSPPTSPIALTHPTLTANGQAGPRGTRSFSHPHILPNSVRLRLMLGTLVNDLFARDFPVPPPRPPLIDIANSSNGVPPSPAPFQLPAPILSSTGDEPIDLPPSVLKKLPPTLHTLSRIAHGCPTNKAVHLSNASSNHPPRFSRPPPPSLPSFSTLTRSLEQPAAPGSSSSAYSNPTHPHAHVNISDRGTHEWRPPVIVSSANSKAFGQNPISAADTHPPKRAVGRAREVYANGTSVASRSTSSSSPSPQPTSRTPTPTSSTTDLSKTLCPRHLTIACAVCTPPFHPVRHALLPKPAAVQRPVYDSRMKSGVTGWRAEDGDGSGVGSGLIVVDSVLRRAVSSSKINGVAPGPQGSDSVSKGTKPEGPSNVRMAELVPRFLRLSALVAMELGREAREEKLDAERESAARVAAIAAAEEARREAELAAAAPPEENASRKGKGKGKGKAVAPSSMDVDVPRSSDTSKGKVCADPPTTQATSSAITPDADAEAMPPPSTLPMKPATFALAPRLRPYANSLRPTREWYALLAGLLTRAVLEGYLSGGWMGAEAAEVGLSIGLGGGLTENPPRREDQPILGEGSPADASQSQTRTPQPEAEEDEYTEFDPDELPGLTDAAMVLFPALRARVGKYAKREGPEADFQEEMEERLQKFLDIPSDVPDLVTHLSNLARAYPVEPVERAAVRFFEAVAKWRGKPELERYKQKTPAPPAPTPTASSSMSIDSLISPSIASMPFRPPSSMGAKAGRSTENGKTPLPIDKYFTQPPPPPPHRRDHRQPQRAQWNSQKRRRSPVPASRLEEPTPPPSSENSEYRRNY